jgi:hypothetical protein
MNKVEMVQRLVEVGLKPKFARVLIYKRMKGPYHIKGEIKKTEKIKTIFLLRYLMGPFKFDVAFVNRKERFLFNKNVNAWFDFHKKMTKEKENEQNVNENP